MNYKNYTPIILVVAGILIGFLCGHSCDKITTVPVKTTDTVFTEVAPLVMRIDTLKPKTRIINKFVYNWDTLIVAKLDTLVKNDTLIRYVSPAYTALLDTICSMDTLRLTYHYPQNVFTDIYHGSKPIKVPYTVNTTTIEPAKSTPLWLTFTTHFVAYSLGIFCGANLK